MAVRLTSFLWYHLFGWLPFLVFETQRLSWILFSFITIVETASWPAGQKSYFMSSEISRKGRCLMMIM